MIESGSFFDDEQPHACRGHEWVACGDGDYEPEPIEHTEPGTK